MDIRLLRYFAAVADEESITRASAQLHISQPALSRQVQQLEAELGCALFDRSGKTMTLTDEGAHLRKRADEILELVAKTEAEMREDITEVKGTVSLGCGDLHAVSLLSNLMGEFKALHPNASFDMYCATADLVIERMDAGFVDIGLLMEPVDAARYESVPSGVRERWVVCMAASDPLAQKKAVRAEELAGRPLVLPRKQRIRGMLAQWLDAAGVKTAHSSTGNLSFGVAMLCKQVGWRALMIEGSVENWRDDTVSCVPLDPPIEATSVIAWRRAGAMGGASRAFAKFVQERLVPKGPFHSSNRAV